MFGEILLSLFVKLVKLIDNMRVEIYYEFGIFDNGLLYVKF